MANVNKTIKHQRFKINYTQNEKIEQVTDLTMVVGVDIGSIMQELLTTEGANLQSGCFLFIMILKDLILSIFGLRHLSRRIKRPQF